MRITTTVGAVTALTAGMFLALPAAPSNATPTGAFTFLPTGVSSTYAEVISGEQLELVNLDPSSSHTLSCPIGSATVSPLKTVPMLVTAPPGTIAFCTVNGATPAVITVV